MIKEAYCSKEISKLLKEKGFDIPVNYEYHYKITIPQFHRKKHNFNGIEYCNCSSEWYSAPTHQMAMKWLREVHKISIDICTVQGKKVSYMFNIWDFSNIYDNKYIGGTFDLREQLYDFDSYEEACEAAIKYCLKNLI